MPSRRRSIRKPTFPYVLNAASSQAQGLVGWWPGDPGGGGKLFDLSGYGNHGTLTNFNFTSASGWTSGLDGGPAVRYDGTDDYVDCGNSRVWQTPAFSASLWVNAAAWTPAYTSILSYLKPTPTTFYAILVKSTGKLAVYMQTNNISAINYDGTGAFTLATNKWYLVTITYNSVAGLKSYVNGLLDASVAANGAMDTSAEATLTLNFGRDQQTAGRLFTGAEEGQRIYNRALSAGEVWSQYDPLTRWSLRYRLGKTRYLLLVPTTLVTFEAAANSGYTAATTSFSGSASWFRDNRLLAIDVSMFGPGVTVSSMTYGGAACTLIGAQSTVTSFGRVEQWIIKQSDSGAPGTGANTLAVTLSGSVAFAITWTAYSGVHQTVPTEAFNSAQATNVGAADATVNITTVAVNDWVHGAIATNDTAITANQTSRNNVTGALGSGADEDTGPIASPGATAISYTGVGALATWAIAGYAIRPTTAVSVGGPFPHYIHRANELAGGMKSMGM